MIKTFKLLFAGIGITLVALTFSPLPAYAGSAAEQIQKGVDKAAGQDDKAKTRDLGDTVRALINIISVIVGAIAVFMLIYGGFRYITSAGNDAGIQAAKNTIIYAIIGLVVVALAQIIVKFVLSSVPT